MGQSGPAYEFRPSQSISSTIVDLAIVAATVYLAKAGVKEPAVWSMLSAIMIGRFGVSHNKTLERATRGGGDGSGRSGQSWPAVTEERDPSSFQAPRPGPPPTPTPRPRPIPEKIRSA